jgi:hypothetical protein
MYVFRIGASSAARGGGWPLIHSTPIWLLNAKLLLILASKVIIDSDSHRTSGHTLLSESSEFQVEVEVEIEVKMRLTVSRPVYRVVELPSGTHYQIFFPVLTIAGFLCEGPSLTRGWICNLLYNCFWDLPEQSLLGRSPAELRLYFTRLIWDSPNLEGQVPLFTSPRNRVAQLYPRALGSLYVASCDS